MPGFSEATVSAGGAAAFFSSSSLSDPPEELPSEATRGAFLPSPAAQASGVEAAPTCGHRRNTEKTKTNYRDRCSTVGPVQTSPDQLDQILQRHTHLDHRRSCRGSVWSVCPTPCGRGPQENCTVDQSLCCNNNNNNNVSLVLIYLNSTNILHFLCVILDLRRTIQTCVNSLSTHPEKGWNSVKLAQPVACGSDGPPAELSHPAEV